MPEMKYRMPQTKSEHQTFSEDPVEFMKRHIKVNLPEASINQRGGAEITSAYSIRHHSKDFYSILAFMTLTTSELLERDFQIYLDSHPSLSIIRS